jgi:hypothetical protein
LRKRKLSTRRCQKGEEDGRTSSAVEFVTHLGRLLVLVDQPCHHPEREDGKAGKGREQRFDVANGLGELAQLLREAVEEPEGRVLVKARHLWEREK